jgi:hypothetical protein
MERKVTEWGCMQALIDFDGWRRWKDLAAKEEATKESKKGDSKADQKAALKAMFSQAPKTRKEREREERELKEREVAQGGGHLSGVVGGGPVGGRIKSPTTLRKAIGKGNTMDAVNGNGYNGTTTFPERR